MTTIVAHALNVSLKSAGYLNVRTTRAKVRIIVIIDFTQSSDVFFFICLPHSIKL